MGIFLRMGWSAEPITRAGGKYGELWKFLEGVNMGEWERVHGLASYFHPDYMFDQKTRAFKEKGGAMGSFVYREMEKGIYSAKALAGIAPTIYKRMPLRPRGVPLEYREATLVVSACLACHEYERIDAACEANDDAQLARHLYWFERFSGLWDRTRTARPPNLDLIYQKKKKAVFWQGKLRSDYSEYMKRNPEATMRRAVKACIKGPGFDRAYRWALKHLK